MTSAQVNAPGPSVAGPRAIFVHTPRTGGQSVKALWKPYLAFADHDFRHPEFRLLPDVQKQYPGIPAFGFVRNPWERVLSAYCHLGEVREHLPDALDFVEYCTSWPTFREFILHGLARAAQEQIHFLPQSYWLCHQDKVAVDIVCRYERFADEVRGLAERFHLPLPEIPHDHKSKHASFQEYFNRDMIAAVQHVYQQDIANFGWEIPEPGEVFREFQTPWRDLILQLVDRMDRIQRTNYSLANELMTTERRLQHAQEMLDLYASDWEATKTVLRRVAGRVEQRGLVLAGCTKLFRVTWRTARLLGPGRRAG